MIRTHTLLVWGCLTLTYALARPVTPAIATAGPATVPDVYGADLSTDRVLPVRGTELPVTAETTAGARVVPPVPSVEAIPTPTAAEFGLIAMAVLIVARPLSRRRRTVHRAACPVAASRSS